MLALFPWNVLDLFSLYFFYSNTLEAIKIILNSLDNEDDDDDDDADD